MTQEQKEIYPANFTPMFNDLKAIYDDYLYMVRQHEFWLLSLPKTEFAEELKNRLCPDGYNFPWKFDVLNEEEKEDFQNFAANNCGGSDNKTYITLQHIKKEEDTYKPAVFNISPYIGSVVCMTLPSMVERYKLSYPQGVTLGQTEFHIDGRYKAVYIGEKNKDKLVDDLLNDQTLLTEISLMINMGERLRKNNYVPDDTLENMITEVYTDEWLNAEENNILEVIGTFAEKVKDICNEKYEDNADKKDNQNESVKNMIKAQKEGFLNIPKFFDNYFELRNFIRHQWESLDELEYYMPKKPQEGKRERREKAYCYLCDKPLFSRLESYLRVLQQMQRIISTINPNYLIRRPFEEYDRFIRRVKATYKQNPAQKLEVEVNYQLGDDHVFNLENDFGEIFSKVKIVESVPGLDNDFVFMINRMEDYKKRSCFLQSFHAVECATIGHCIRRGKTCNDRGKNLTVYDALDYLKKIGIITRSECERWKQYGKLRNKLSHRYFSTDLKNSLETVYEQYCEDLQIMQKKMCDASPIATKIREGIFEYQNKDGKIVTLDHINHKIVPNEDRPRQQLTTQAKAMAKSDKKTPIQDYYNGLKFKFDKDKIAEVQLPNGVVIDLKNRSIEWDDKTRWYTNSKEKNVLQTNSSAVWTDKNLNVTKIFINNRPISFCAGDRLLIDYHHSLVLSGNNKIREFIVKNSENNEITAKFNHTTSDASDLISFNDGTKVFLSPREETTIMHNGKTLRYNTIEEFAKTYVELQISPQEIIKHGNGR